MGCTGCGGRRTKKTFEQWSALRQRTAARHGATLTAAGAFRPKKKPEDTKDSETNVTKD